MALRPNSDTGQNLMKKSILLSLMVIGAVAALIATSTMASFSDEVTSDDNSFTAGTIFLSVDDNCGSEDAEAPLASESQDRTAGSDTVCARGAALTISAMKPGDAASTHTFDIRNDGSIAGLLDVTVTATPTGTCAVGSDWLVSANVVNQALAAGGTTTYALSVTLDSSAGNECQGESLDVDILFRIDQS